MARAPATPGDTGPGTAGTRDGTASGDDDDDDNTGGGPRFDLPGSMEETGTVPCEVQSPEVTYVEPIITFVLDKSGSMSINQFDAGMAGTITRWNALHNTVSYLLTTYDASIAFGSKLFPSANGCPVNAGLDINPALNNEAAIIASMPAPGADLNAAAPRTRRSSGAWKRPRPSCRARIRPFPRRSCSCSMAV